MRDKAIEILELRGLTAIHIEDGKDCASWCRCDICVTRKAVSDTLYELQKQPPAGEAFHKAAREVQDKIYQEEFTKLQAEIERLKAILDVYRLKIKELPKWLEEAEQALKGC